MSLVTLLVIGQGNGFESFTNLMFGANYCVFDG